MRKSLIVLLGLLAGLCITGFINAQRIPEKGSSVQGVRELAKPTRNVRAEGLNLPAAPQNRRVSKEALYSEDFEGVSGLYPYLLPDGWTAIATPGYDDVWQGGTVAVDGVPIWGHSGQKYAHVIYKEHAHDTWAFTPGIELVAGTSYDLTFFVYISGFMNTYEALEVKMGMSPTVSGMTVLCYNKNNEHITPWQEVSYRFTAETSGTWYIGLHSYSPAYGNITLVDDISVQVTPTTSSFSGATTVDFGNVFHNIGRTYTQTYSIKNRGVLPLTVAFSSASPEVSVTGLPLTVDAGAEANITIELSPNEDENYAGNFVLTTNDPDNATVTVAVTATGQAATVSGFHYEDFENTPVVYVPQPPEGWISEGFSVNAGSGVDGSKSFRGAAYGGSSPQAVTHYVDMGTAPKVSFWYRALNYAGGAPTPANGVVFVISVSEDFGTTFNEVYRIEPGGTNEHAQSADYAFVNVDLDAYANKLCMVRMKAESINGSDFYMAIDNMSIGTETVNDLVAVSVSGNITPSVGATATYAVSVENIGSATQTAYTVKLMQQGGVELASVAGTEIAGGETKAIDITWTPSAEGAVTLYGEVALDGDESAINNKTPNCSVTVLPEGITGVTVGTGNVMQATLPFNFSYKHNRAQSIYFASEIGQSESGIVGIMYYPDFVTDLTDKHVKIWMANTSAEGLDAWIPSEEFTQVFDGTVNISGTAPVSIPLDQLFVYTGGNLVVMTEREMDSETFNMYDCWLATGTETANRSRHYDNDHTSFDWSQPGNAIHTFPNTAFLLKTEGSSVSGTVTDGTSPVEGAEVLIAGIGAQLTDASGHYAFSFVPEGTYGISASKFGYETSSVQQISVTADEDVLLNITMEPIVNDITVSGTVTVIGTSTPVAGATVKMEGYADMETTTGTDGGYIVENVFANHTYTMTVTAEGFITYEGTVEVEAGDVTHNVELNEIPSPVQLVLATPNNDDTQVEVKWYAPGAAPLIEKTYTLDDGTAENGWMANPNYALQAGNQFVTTDQGTIQSIATYWQDNVNASGRQVSINIYNAGRELVGSSELFTPPANDWITVPLTSAVAFSGDFYVMVNVPAAPGATEYLGYDQNGPNAASNLDWYYDAAEGAWVNLHDAGQSPAGILTIRANAMVAGEAKSYGYAAESSNNPFNRNKEVTIQASLMNPAAPVETGNPVVTGRADSNPKALVNYSVYRLLKGQEEAEWTSLGTTVDTAYVDNTWATAPSGIYRYAVKVNYTGSTSTATQSKDVPKDMYVQVTVHLTTNSGDPVYGAMVALEHENPEYTQGLAATNSNVIFPTVWKGTYNLTVALEGFEPHSETIVVNGDMTVDVELTEIIETPYGLKVETTDTPADRQFSWNNIPEPFSDDIESYEDFIIEGIGEYILHDEDGGTPYGFGGATYPNMLEPQSWIVFNPSTVDPPFTTGSAHSPHSGTKYLACFSQQTPPNNDWLILPEIQVISGTVFSFWAKTYTASYGLERMKIAVSTTGTDPDDFTVISEGDYLSVPTAWTEYTFDLSDYAGQEIYLAINCVSNDAFFLMVDDIFVGIPAKGANAAKSFTGYTVYLDDEDEAIAEGIMETQYILTDLTVDTHRAGVKAVYSSGESEIVWTEPFTILAPEYTVTFTVTNENGEPVEGATIVFNGETLDSYIASGVTAGEYDYTVSKTGYTTATGTVEVIDQNVTEEVTLGTVGIDSNSLATIHLHPNPFTDEITVSNPAAVRNIQITDAAGQKVKEVVLESKTISTGELSSGVYFVTIETVTGEKAVYKMVKK